MPYDATLADRVRTHLAGLGVVVDREYRMMGGLAFNIGGRMGLAVDRDQLIVRVDPADHEHHVRHPHVLPMDITGCVQRGFVMVTADGIATDDDLVAWLHLATIGGIGDDRSMHRRDSASARSDS